MVDKIGFTFALVSFLGLPSLAQNPNDPNWDWMTPSFPVYFVNQDSHVSNLTILGPFNTAGSDVFKEDMRARDFWKEDGWVLVCQDFGSPLMAPSMPYMVLYNKFRGIIRILSYNSNKISFSAYTCKLELLDGTTVKSDNPEDVINAIHSAPLFTFSAFPSCFMNDYDGTAVQQNINRFKMKQLDGWLCADFVATGYDPYLSAKKPVLIFSIGGIDIANIQLENRGSISLSQVINNISPYANVASDTENTAFSSKDSGYSNYRDDNTAINEISNGGNAHWVSDALSLVTSVSGYPELAPLTSSIAGLVTSFVGGGKEQPVALNFQGKIQFKTSGIFSMEKPITSKAFYLNEGEQNPGTLRPNRHIPWGIFNIEKQPDVVDYMTPAGSSGYIHQVAIRNSPDILVNPDIGFTSVRKGIAFTFKDGPPGMMLEPSMANPGGTYFEYSKDPRTIYTFTSKTSQLPTGMALQLLCDLPGTPVLMPRRNEILKVYPIAIQDQITAKVSSSYQALSRERPEPQVEAFFSATAADADPDATYTYSWNFPGTWGELPGRVVRYGWLDRGTFTGRSIRVPFALYGYHAGTLTVTDNGGHSVVVPFDLNCKPPHGGGGHR